MSDITLTATDGHELAAFHLLPEGRPRGGLVIVQEIFGVNDHIRAVVALFTGLGYATIAPALFDRVERGVRLGYSVADHDTGLGFATKLSPQGFVDDLAAAVAAVAPAGKVGVLGYCLGGMGAWRAAARVEGISAAVSYYGAQIPMFVRERPRVPIQFHLGRRDGYWPIEKAREICGAVEGGEVNEYDADHGFACDHRPAVFDAAASAAALQRTLRFLGEHVG